MKQKEIELKKAIIYFTNGIKQYINVLEFLPEDLLKQLGYRNFRKRKFNITKQYLKEEFLRKNRTAIDISKELGCHEQTIWRNLKKYNLTGIKTGIKNIDEDLRFKSIKLIIINAIKNSKETNLKNLRKLTKDLCSLSKLKSELRKLYLDGFISNFRKDIRWIKTKRFNSEDWLDNKRKEIKDAQ